MAGWADWEKGKAIFNRIKVPPAPPLGPDEALNSFKLAPGYRIELVAAEPMIANPIFFEFDPDGRIWAIEYRGYMRDLQGSGEGDSICRIVVLEDADADGRADRSTVFLDKLVMPRSFAFVRGGLLVAEPPHLWLCEDTDGDLKCDRKTEVGKYGVAGNPQHTANGLRYGIDNWLHSADWPKRHRFSNGRLIEADTIHRGQFGVSFDDLGRFYTCYESSALHADLIPAEYLLRSSHLRKAVSRGGNERFGTAANIAREAKEVFPIRPTPQITLGGLELRDDGRLRTYTIVSGSCIYNGDQFPADAYGNAFVPEAGGHLIGRLRLEGAIDLRATRYYPPEQELLASTDERFRPVNARVGPDGALYIADMYHGIIEHVIFLVPWLTEQIKERNLESGNDMGRIWRIVSGSKPINRRAPQLSKASSDELMRMLAHPNGWWRLTAQRLFVERRETNIVPALRKLAASSSPSSHDISTPAQRPLPDTNALARLHALWTLDGLGGLEPRTVIAALGDTHEFVRATAARLSERFSNNSALANLLLDGLEKCAPDPSRLVRLHALLALGALRGDRTEGLIARFISADEHALFRVAALTGLSGRELEFLERLLSNADWRERSEFRRAMLSDLAQAVFDEGQPARVGQLLRVANDHSPRLEWARDAVVDGVLAAAPRDLSQFRRFELPTEPALLATLQKAETPELRQKGYRLHQLITWPGDTTLRAAAVDVQPLTEAQRRLVEEGQTIFTATCAACHQPHGGGLANVAPPLDGSEWVNGTADRLVRIVLHGLYGPLEAGGQSWNHHMPAFGESVLTNDTQVAAVLSYTRRAWGHTAPTIQPDVVAEIRKAHRGRELPWTVAELDSSSVASAIGRSSSMVQADAAGAILLSARTAVTYGRRLKYNPTLDILAPWVEENDVAEWQVETPAEGAYELRVILGADTASAGDQFVIETSSSRLTGTVPSTGSNANLEERVFGTLRLPGGRSRVLMRPEGKLRRELADVRAIRLVPQGR